MNEWARGVRRIAVLTGAGISTDSGIPDYRGPNGAWTHDPASAALFTLDNFLADKSVRHRFWQHYLDHPAWLANPNPAHHALAELSAGPAVRILTQNIDGLHQRAGVPTRKVLELHGTMHNTVCTACPTTLPTPEVLARVRAGDPDPACPTCAGILKPATILFGQHLNPEVIAQARTIAAASQLLLAVGTTLQVDPAASLCAVALHAGAHLVIINATPTPYDEHATEVIRTPIGEALPRICRTLLSSFASS